LTYVNSKLKDGKISAHLPGEAQPVVYSVHGAIAERFKVDPAKIGKSHAGTIDYVISTTAG